jgi:CsoR family transcriptional regulator, copper-sensing transcriptional repressor
MAEGIHTATLSDEERRALVNRLKRLEGQVRGLQSMVESGKGCEDVLTQVMAVKSALNQVGLRMIAYSMKGCLIREEDASREELIDEALSVFLKYAGCVSPGIVE